MRVAVASDHAGFQLKELLKGHLVREGFDVVDCGASSDERSDYPDYAKAAARLVSEKKVQRAVLACGSGIGMCMVANRFAGVRAAVLHDDFDAEMSRKHNDANVACLGSRSMDAAKALSLADIFLKTEFEGGRHAARIDKIDRQ